MNDSKGPRYRMTLSLNVLNHLGLGLYSNVPAVLSEAVANSWDADAENVTIKINRELKTITIEDDGHGMSIDDVNDKYLYVGYKRREKPDEAVTTKFNRRVMGRKGIGKLSLFSIAKTVEVHSITNGDFHGFRMDLEKINKVIEDVNTTHYSPDPISSEAIEISEGTKIILSDLKRELRSDKWLRRRLARRFSIIGSNYSFNIKLNGEPITVEDRAYYDKLQYIWTYGTRGEAVSSVAKTQKHDQRPSEIEEYQDGDLKIDGWIGTAQQAGQLKDVDTQESLNKIVIMVRGKLAQEDILEEFGEGGVYSKYIMGEIHADFLDDDDEEDIATTSRQKIIEDDVRYQALKEKLRTELKYIQQKWTGFRNEDGQKKAMTIPQIKEWFADLNADHKKVAKKLFGNIFQLPIDDEPDQRQLFISSILAFEGLKLRNLLNRIEEISVNNLEILTDVFTQLNDLEASAYYQIIRERLAVIRGLTNLVDEDAKEKALQKYLFKHLWLLDPSWEKATSTERMERRIYTALDGVYKMLPEEQRLSRLDIKYSTTGNKHVIIELKRASISFRAISLTEQLDKYRDASMQVLRSMGRSDEPLEFVCVIGKPLKDWESSEGFYKARRMLDSVNGRIATYDGLIDNALQAYDDYVEQEEHVGRIYKLIMSISQEDFRSLSPN